VSRCTIHCCCALLLIIAAVCSPGLVRGQEQPAPNQADTNTPSPASPTPQRSRTRTRPAYRRHTIDERVAQFSKALDLDDTQKAGVKAILERQQMRTRQLQLDSNISGEERINRFRALQQETVARIRALLNDEQKKKYDPLNHSSQDAASDKYLDQWVKNHQRSAAPPPPGQK
jgi:hypothetical protein